MSIKTDIKLDLDEKKVQKALRASEKQMERLHRRSAKRTAVNVRAIASKGNLGLVENSRNGAGLRRKKVPEGGGSWEELTVPSRRNDRLAKELFIQPRCLSLRLFPLIVLSLNLLTPSAFLENLSTLSILTPAPARPPTGAAPHRSISLFPLGIRLGTNGPRD